jgi:hypothetical protein
LRFQEANFIGEKARIIADQRANNGLFREHVCWFLNCKFDKLTEKVFIGEVIAYPYAAAVHRFFCDKFGALSLGEVLIQTATRLTSNADPFQFGIQ